MAAISSSMNAWVERHATTAPLARASSKPIALSRWVFPSPLFPTRTSGLYFFPGRAITARAALTAPAPPPRRGALAEPPGPVREELPELVRGGRGPARDRGSRRHRGLRFQAEQLFRRLRVDLRLVDRLVGDQPVQRAHQL